MKKKFSLTIVFYLTLNSKYFPVILNEFRKKIKQKGVRYISFGDNHIIYIKKQMNNKKQIDFIFSATNILEIQAFLDKNLKLNIPQFKDAKKNNILHQAAFQNKFSIMKIYIQYMTNFYQNQSATSSNPINIKKLITAWINDCNDEGFTPIHYAAFKGDLEIVKFLQGLGASLLFQTKQGTNMIHLAAQGDSLNVLIYLHDFFDLNRVDIKKMTALHWASYMGSENVADFLLAFDYIQKDGYNEQGLTPLHLATNYGNTKIVKSLLLKGANRFLLNKEGQTALAIAKQNGFKNIVKMLDENFTLLDHIRFYCNLKIQYKPKDRSISKVILLFLTFIFLSANSHILIIFNFNQYYLILPGVYFLFYFVIYTSLIQSPAKNLEKKPFKELLNRLPICVECRIPKENRSYHCDICKICIDQYDHHCPWINNCVGKNNLARFIMFLLLILIGMIQIGSISVLTLLKNELIFSGYRFNQYEWLQYCYIVIFVINLIIIGTFLIPVLMLLSVQITNLLLNQTTFQRFSKSQKHKIEEQSVNKINQSETGSIESKLLHSSVHSNQLSPSFSNCKLMCYNQIDQSQ